MYCVCLQAESDHMTLNATKGVTMQMIFAKQKPPPLQTTANLECVPSVDLLKLLGVTIQNPMKWDT